MYRDAKAEITIRVVSSAGIPDRNGPKILGGKKMSWNVTVDTDKCIGCGECVDVCPVEVYEMNDGKSNPAHYEECLGCESCVEVCESNAITVEEN